MAMRKKIRSTLINHPVLYESVSRIAIFLGLARKRVYTQAQYTTWVKSYESKVALMEGKSNGTSSKLLLSIVVPFWNTEQRYLNELMESLGRQRGANWELIMVDISDDSSKSLAIKRWSEVSEK